jgi:fructosamine-3-kinase
VRAAHTFRKDDPSAAPGFFAAEVAGLTWLAEATAAGGVPVVPVLDSGPHHLTLPRLAPVPPSRSQAQEFGRRLAATHRSGAARHGAPPPRLAASGFIATLPLPHDLGEGPEPVGPAGMPWGRFYARLRLAPFARAARDAGTLGPAQAAVVERICARLEDGDEDLTGPAEPVSRLHGDLWSGNVVWTADGGVLIDPAAHGGHRETDLAMLALFGLPHRDDVIAAYDEADPLADGHQQRIGLHQLHPLLVHTVLFGGSYAAQAATVAARYA